MREAIVALVLTAGVALGQNPKSSTAPAQPNGSISGAVRSEGTGTPIADVSVTVYVNSRFINGATARSANTKEVTAVTDSQGRYRLSDLPANIYRVFATSKNEGPGSERTVNLRPGQELNSINFSLPVPGVITGRVLDQNKEPVQGAAVYLMSKEYSVDQVGYFLKGIAIVNDLGDYTLRGVEPGHPYLLMAGKRRVPNLPAISEAPTDLELRRPAFVPTFYPGSPEPEGGIQIALRAGERREGLDFRMLRGQAYCIEGMLAGVGPAGGRFMIAGQEYRGTTAWGGGMVEIPMGGTVGSDGKFRICDLRAGNYRLTGYVGHPSDPNTPPEFGTVDVMITDNDVKKVQVNVNPGLRIPGGVSWEGTPPDFTTPSRVMVNLEPTNRTSLEGEPEYVIRSPCPGEFQFPYVLIDEYYVQAGVNAAGVFVKDILYGTTSVLHTSLRVGSAVGNAEIRVLLAHDGGKISAKVADKDGNPVPDIHVVIMPAEVPSESALSPRMIFGETDQDGNYSYYTALPPGKYIVLATEQRVDHTVERIAKIWQARERGKVVEVGPNATVQVTIEPATI